MNVKPQNNHPAIELLESRVLHSGGASDLSHSTASLLSHPQAIYGNSPRVGTRAGSKALFYFGDPDGTVDVFDAKTSQWSTTILPRADFPIISGTSLGNQAIFASGNKAAIYNSDNGTWSSVKLAREGLWRFALSVGGQAMFVGTKPSNMGAPFAVFFDPRSGRSYAAKLPKGADPTHAVVVGNKALLADPDRGILEIYNADTKRWSTTAYPSGVGLSGQTSVGTTALFVGNGATAYDTVTGLFKTEQISQERSSIAATSVGTKALFAGGFIGASYSNVVDVYDANSASWSTTSLSEARFGIPAAAVGTKAVFAGGSLSPREGLIAPLDTVDIFTDTAPSAVLSGGLTGGIGHRDTVTVINSGDADLAGPYSINLYASTDRTLTGAILVGSRGVTSPLLAGASATFGVRTIQPKDLPAGTYHLLAAVRDAAGNITPIAAEDSTFRIGASKSALPSASRKTLHAGGGAFTELAKIGRSP